MRIDDPNRMGLRPVSGQAVMDEVSGIIGEAACALLARNFGGVSLYVPQKIKDRHAICLAIGREAADRLSSWFGGMKITMPRQVAKRARVVELARQGWTRAKIAIETGYSERHVYTLLKEAGVNATA